MGGRFTRKMRRKEELRELVEEELTADVMEALQKAVGGFKESPERDAALVTTLLCVCADQVAREDCSKDEWLVTCSQIWDMRNASRLEEN